MINLRRWRYLPKCILKELQELIDEFNKKESVIKRLEAELELIRNEQR